MKFEINRVYSCRSVCNCECSFSYLILDRTAKTVTIEDELGRSRRCKICQDGDGEYIFPEGKYSMAPLLRPKTYAR